MRRRTIKDVIKATQDFRDKFAALPKSAIDLDEWIAYSPKIEEQVTDGKINWPKKHEPCNSVGCVGGWGKEFYGLRFYALIGVESLKYYTPIVDNLFDPRVKCNKSQRAEALERIDTRIKELKVLEKDPNAYPA